MAHYMGGRNLLLGIPLKGIAKSKQGKREISICQLERKHRLIIVKIINTDKIHCGLQWVFV